MPNIPNGKYGMRAWDKAVGVPIQAAYPPQAYIGPFASNQERLLSQAIQVGQMTAAEVQQYVRPNLPQIELFPDRYGFSQFEYGISDIIQVSGRSSQRTDFSGAPTTQESTSRNTLGKV
jgi:hypothetical protein